MTRIAAGIWLLVSIAAAANAGELVANGGFETGSFAGGWVDGAGQIASGATDPRWADHRVVLDLPRSGAWSALIGFKYAPVRGNRFGYVYQDVAIPANVSSATLFFSFRQQGYDGLGYDPFRMQIRSTSNAVLATVVDYSFGEANHLFKDSGWLDDDGAAPAGYSMAAYAGQTVRLYFYQENSFNNFYETWTYIDDVSLVYRRWVDLAVDGDGDDRFGALGTGEGGYAVRSAFAGDTIVYLLDVENEGPVDDEYLLSAGIPAGWGASVRYGGAVHALPWTTPLVAAGTKITVEVAVSVPTGAALGGYSTIIDAVSTAHANRHDSANLSTNVVPVECLADLVIDANGYGVIDPSGGGGVSYRETAPGAQVTYAVELHNGGERADAFRIHWTAPSPLSAEMVAGGVVRTGAFDTAPIASGGSASFTFRASVPASALGGDYTSVVYAASLTDTLKADGVRAVARVLAPNVDVIICGSGDGIVDPTGAGLGGAISVSGTRGTTIHFPFTIQNEGGVADAFAVSWVPPAGGWTASVVDGATSRPLPWTTPVMAPRSEREYLFAVTVPANAGYDTYVSIFNFVSTAAGWVRESVGASISVSTGNEIDLVIDGAGDNMYGYLGTALGGSSLRTAAPGETIEFAVTVQNEMGENLFDIWWTPPPAWEVRIGDSTSAMRGVPAGSYTMTVVVPADCAGGAFDVVVDGCKTNKRYFVDSVLGRILVAPPRVVDALVDGNGVGVFGEPGTGAGGKSSQSTIAGRTIRFAVELRNLGGETESYRISWNAFPGLIAALAGSASPLSTVPVAPGGSVLLSFEVRVPLSAWLGDYDYVIDVVSTLDSLNNESVLARVHVDPPPRADLVIDGDGAFVSALPGSGGGGSALVFGPPGGTAGAALELWNRGGFPDSFRVSWAPPAGWPAGSIVLSDAGGDHTSPYDVGVIAPGECRTFTVVVSVPSGAALRTPIIIDGVALSRDLEDSATLEVGTGSFVTGIVFNDRDHDGAHDPGEEGWVGVPVILSGPDGTLSAITDGASSFTFEAAAGVPRTLVELQPAGMISLSPDTVALAAAAPGETLRVDFADVRGPVISPSNDLGCVAGGFVDAPHVIVAGTAGQASLSAALPAGWVEAFYRDNDGDGRCGPGDSLLAAADLALDPDIPGRDVVRIVLRVFVPPQAPVGTAATVTVTLRQTLAATTITAEVSTVDRILVLASSSGLLVLEKAVDLAAARPGDVMTYTIVFRNPGLEAVQEIEIIDPLPAAVEIVRDVFGPGNDIEWIRDGVAVYLTADPGDPDEAMYESADERLRVVLSRRTPYLLESGASGAVTYRVRVR